MDAKTKKYLIVGGAIVLGLYGYRMLMRKLNTPSEEQIAMFDKDMVLEKGSQGSEVSELQRRLKEDFGKYLGETGIDNETALFEAKGVKSITLNQL
jgi:hypothetical protein